MWHIDFDCIVDIRLDPLSEPRLGKMWGTGHKQVFGYVMSKDRGLVYYNILPATLYENQGDWR